MIVTGEAVAQFVSEKCGFAVCPPYTSIGIEVDGEVIAGAIIHVFEGPSCHVTAAGHGWTLGFMRALGDYVYNQLGCERMTFTTEQEQAARYIERLGGKREGLLRSQFGKGRDGIVIGVLREEYRYID